LIALVILSLVALLAAACGGEGQGGNQAGSQGDDRKEHVPSAQNAQARRSGNDEEKERPKMQLATGVVMTIIGDNNRFVLRPEEGKNILFRFNPKVV
jgi:hypothetical protein